MAHERSIRITASFFGRVCKRLPTTTLDSLVNSIVDKNIYKSAPAACAWGKDNDGKARDAYIENMEINGHRNFKVQASGLVINREFCFLGASPDDVVYDPLCPLCAEGYFSTSCCPTKIFLLFGE